MDTELLKELGFTGAAEKIDRGQNLKKKLAIAYEHYRFVSPDVFDRFEKRLKEKTEHIDIPCPKCNGGKEVEVSVWLLEKEKKSCVYCRGTGARRMTYDTLVFIPLKDYQEVPPPDCLMDLKKAKDMGCFDNFEVAKVETVEVRPDPIIFGLVDNCVDKFFITQWDNDVKIEDI